MPSYAVNWDDGLFKNFIRDRVRDEKGRFAKVINASELQKAYAEYIVEKLDKYIPCRTGNLINSVKYTESSRYGGVRITWDAADESGFKYATRAYTARSHKYPQQIHKDAVSYWNEIGIDREWDSIFAYGNQLVKQAIKER